MLGYWLLRKSLSGDGFDPFRSIMELDDTARAQTIIARTGKKFPGDYLAERRRIENWLRSEGEKFGLETDKLPPIYFKLTAGLSAPEAGEGRAWIAFRAEAIPALHLTFTVQDSFHNYAVLTDTRTSTTPPDLDPRVFDAATLREHIESGRIPAELMTSRGDRYVECQVWSRRALQESSHQRFLRHE